MHCISIIFNTIVISNSMVSMVSMFVVMCIMIVIISIVVIVMINRTIIMIMITNRSVPSPSAGRSTTGCTTYMFT